jgi:hypothetical protein
LDAIENNQDTGALFKKYEYVPTAEEAANVARLEQDYKKSQMPIFKFGKGSNIGKYHVAIKNPLRMPDVKNWGSLKEIKKHLPFDTEARTHGEQIGDIRKRGYHGIVYQNAVENPVMRTDSYIAFDPTQIKSAIGNRGTYDPNEADIGKAEAARYPSLSLAGSIGPLRSEAAGLTVNATTWSIGPTLNIPLFDAGRRAAGVEAARVAYVAAEAAYRERVRVAVREVEEALLRLADTDEREQSALIASAGYRQAFDAAGVRYRAGLGNLVEVHAQLAGQLGDIPKNIAQFELEPLDNLSGELSALVADHLFHLVGHLARLPAQPQGGINRVAPRIGITGRSPRLELVGLEIHRLTQPLGARMVVSGLPMASGCPSPISCVAPRSWPRLGPPPSHRKGSGS